MVETDPQKIIDTPKEPACSPIGDIFEIDIIMGCPDKTTKIGTDLLNPLRKEIIYLIRDYSDIFYWDSKDMPGILETIARHSLHVNNKVHPVCQKKRTFFEEK